MKRVGIVTIIDNENCGNRLQNYALQEVLKKLDFDVVTLRNDKLLNHRKHYYMNYLRYIKKNILNFFKGNWQLKHNFRMFNQYICFSKRKITCLTKNISCQYDYFVVGSDQVWKPTRKRMSYVDLLSFAPDDKRIAYAASFGIQEIDELSKEILKRELPKFKSISVREEAGKRIIEEATSLKNIEVVVDPTMLLMDSEWEMLEYNPFKSSKDGYVLAYFLGDENLDDLKVYCEKNHLELINFYDSLYQFGPREFLYLIHHASAIYTDSFHGCVFSIIFHKEFFVFERKESAMNNNMNSRLETLLHTFCLENRMISHLDESLKVSSYSSQEIDKILTTQREKSLQFLKCAFDIDE